LGLALVFLGRLAAAEDRFRDALEAARDFGHQHRAAESIIGLAAIAAVQGDVGRARELRAIAAAILDSVDGEPARPERELERLFIAPLLERVDAATATDSTHVAALPFTQQIDVALGRAQPLTGVRRES